MINIARPDGTFEVASVAGDERARAMLLGTVDSAEMWDGLLAASEPWGRLRFADHRNESAYLDLLTWIPDVEPVDAEDAWHPEDALFAPLIGSDGTRVGILSVDLPRGRPPPEPGDLPRPRGLRGVHRARDRARHAAGPRRGVRGCSASRPAGTR